MPYLARRFDSTYQMLRSMDFVEFKEQAYGLAKEHLCCAGR